MADVFISYRSKSALGLVRDVICPAIEAAGFTCWYAKRDMKPGPYPPQIIRAIGDCRVFLLILEQAALCVGHIRSETALAFRRWNANESITLLPFQIDGCDLREDDLLYYYLVCQQIVDGCPPDAEHIRELADKIAEIPLALS